MINREEYAWKTCPVDLCSLVLSLIFPNCMELIKHTIENSPPEQETTSTLLHKFCDTMF